MFWRSYVGRGGYYKAIEAAAALKMDCVQIFTSSPSQWPVSPRTKASGDSDAAAKKKSPKTKAGGFDAARWESKAMPDAQVTDWQKSWKSHRLRHPIAHGSYLINLAAPDDDLWQRSIAALVVELTRAGALGLEGLVVHPGAFTTSDLETGLQRVVEGVKTVLRVTEGNTTRLLLENTAGQGSCLGWQIEQLGFMIKQIDQHERVGVCIDTCHAFAAGYDLREDTGLENFCRELKSELPKNCVAAMHVNDSKAALGKRVDRHEHIGQGQLGDDAFRKIINHRFFKSLPMYLETPKGNDEVTGQDWDQMNLERLRSLVA